jgi:hypothetical protein
MTNENLSWRDLNIFKLENVNKTTVDINIIFIIPLYSLEIDYQKIN